MKRTTIGFIFIVTLWGALFHMGMHRLSRAVIQHWVHIVDQKQNRVTAAQYHHKSQLQKWISSCQARFYTCHINDSALSLTHTPSTNEAIEQVLDWTANFPHATTQLSIREDIIHANIQF